VFCIKKYFFKNIFDISMFKWSKNTQKINLKQKIIYKKFKKHNKTAKSNTALVGYVWQCGCDCFLNSFSCQNACQ
jgi:putative lipase involved disintegration of autophagic bodies